MTEKATPARIHAEQVVQAYRYLLVSALVNLMLAPFMAALLWKIIDHGRIALWLGAIFLINLLRVRLHSFYQKHHLAIPDSRFWARRYTIALAASGLVWGSGAVFLFPESSPMHQIFMAFVFGGLISGATGSAASLRHAFTPFCLLLTVPIFCRFLLIGSPMHLAMATMTAIYTVFALLVAQGINKVLREGIELRYARENEIFTRRNAEQELRRHQEQLEEMVAERTMALSDANQELQNEITQRMQAEVALREGEQKFRRLIESLKPNYFFYSHDTEGMFTYVSPAVTDMLGYSQEEFLNSCKTHLTANPINQEAERKTELSIQGIQQQPYELEILHKDGSTRSLEVLESPVFDDSGKVVAVEGIAHDITERKRVTSELKESEERLRLALSASAQGIYDLNVQTGEAQVNPEYALMLGYEPEEFHETNEKWIARLHPEDRDRVNQLFIAYTQGKVDEYRVEFRQKTKEGAWKWILSIGEIVDRDATGRPLRMLGTHTDITMFKQAEEELLKAKKLESIGMLAGGIAHDFNNLLTVILGNIELCKMIEPANPEIKDLLEDSKAASLRAKDIVQRFLTFSTGGSPMKRVVDVQIPLQEAVGLALSGSTIDLALNLDQGLWQAKIDPGQISQALLEIVENAKDAMPEGGKLNIRGENIHFAPSSRLGSHALAKGDYVKITIQDSGQGISEKNIHRVFDPYFSTKTRGTDKGTGLGLSTAYSIIKKHDGFIEIFSEEGRGTSIDIYLPRALAVEEKARVPVATPAIKAGKKRILVMDDEELIRNLTHGMLDHLGHEALLTENGEQALELYTKAKEEGNPFDLVILDLTIKGGMGGKDTMKNLHALDPQVKAIVASGYSSDPVMSNFREYGFLAAVQKPFSIDEIRKVLSRISA